jgi:exodeoxyribonuclease V alpha subunit
MVGDVDQLPPVGAGNVLKDMIHSGKINKVNFKKIFRQDNSSKIVENAHRILKGEEPIYNTDNTDFFFVSADEANNACQTIQDLMLTRLPNFLNIDPAKIQILTPMRKTALGSKELNNSIKSVLNPIHKNQIQKTANGYTFTKFDRVMQTKNDYEMEWSTKDGQSGEGIFNGDMGVITDIDPHNGEMTILFDDEKIVIYDFLKLENLELSYAITVHKSQGSEFDAVIIPLVYGYSQLLTRNLLYTAITRAKSFVAIVGRKECVLKMIANDIEQKRHTGLKEFL